MPLLVIVSLLEAEPCDAELCDTEPCDTEPCDTWLMKLARVAEVVALLGMALIRAARAEDTELAGAVVAG